MEENRRIHAIGLEENKSKNTAMSKTIICLSLACVATLFLSAGCETYSRSARQYRNTTPVPAGVAAPGRLGTRFGTLHFFDGVPDQSSAEKIYNNLDYQR